MAHFKYIGRTKKGEKVNGVVESPDRAGAVRQIEALGHLPISISETTKTVKQDGEKKSGLNFELGFNRKPKMKTKELLQFSRELSDLLQSGMTLGHALNTLAKRDNAGPSGVVLTTLRDEIVQGTSLSDALGLFPDTFSVLYINLVRSGEASGNLPSALENVCHHYERVQEATSKVIIALTYPTIVLGIGMLAVLFLMVKVVPQFTPVFEEMEVALPASTQLLIAMSNGLIKYGIVLILIIVGSIIAVKKVLATPGGLLWWHKQQLKLPVLKQIVTANAYSHFSRTLGTLLGNGVPLLQALKIVQNTVSNLVISNAIGNARERVTEGSSISAPLTAAKAFPTLLTDMIATGEETGDLTTALSHITRRYDNELDQSVKICTTVLEPLLIVGVALIVGFIAISLLMPVFSITDSINM